VRFNIAVLGVAAVGKSAITHRFIRNTFVADYEPTIEDHYVKNTDIDGPTQLSVLDTAGMEDYNLLIDQWIVDKDGLILVYGVDIPDSLSALQMFSRKIANKYDMADEKKAPVVVLAGNKIDKDRIVTTEEGQQFADQIGVKYFETSAATNINVEEMFVYIVKELKRRRE
jgi:small GTP-binding protein